MGFRSKYRPHYSNETSCLQCGEKRKTVKKIREYYCTTESSIVSALPISPNHDRTRQPFITSHHLQLRTASYALNTLNLFVHGLTMNIQSQIKLCTPKPKNSRCHSYLATTKATRLFTCTPAHPTPTKKDSESPLLPSSDVFATM